MFKTLYKVFDVVASFIIFVYALYMLWKPDPTIKDVVVLGAIILIIVIGNQSKIEELQEKLNE